MPDSSNNKHLPPFTLFRGDSFDIAFAKYFHSPELEIVRNFLTKKKRTVGDVDATYRAINSWCAAGLLLDVREDEGGWRKFSLVDVCWVLVIRELRGLGFSIEKIKKLKQSIFFTDINSDKAFSDIFEYYVSRVFCHHDVLIICAPDGQGNIGLEGEFQTAQLLAPFPTTYISISINKLCAELLNRPELAKKNKTLSVLSDKEEEIREKLFFDQELKEVVIQPKEGEIGRVSYKTHKQNPADAVDAIKKALNQGNFQEITIKQQDGKVVFMEQIVKK